MLFGEAAIRDAVINGRVEANGVGHAQIGRDDKFGFQFYDTFVKSVLTRVTFRNFPLSATESAIRFMDHSDQFNPQGINAVKGLRFENVAQRIRLKQCGADCGNQYDETMSARIASVWDHDGSLTGSGVPSIVGSNFMWWKLDDTSCDRFEQVWRCDWTQNRHVASFQIQVPGYTFSHGGNCGTDFSDFGPCSGQNATHDAGFAALWGHGADHGIRTSPWGPLAGHADAGWYWRAKTNNANTVIDGAPSQVLLKDFQIPLGHFVVLAIAYPSTAQFSVGIKALWWGPPGVPDPIKSLAMSTKAEVGSS